MARSTNWKKPTQVKNKKEKETVKQRKRRKTNKKAKTWTSRKKLKETEQENTDRKTKITRLQEDNEDIGTRQDKSEQINDTLLKSYINTGITHGQTKDIYQENKSPKPSQLETGEAEWLFVNTVYSTEECLRLLDEQEHHDT